VGRLLWSVGVGGTGILAALFGAMVVAMLPGKGGKGMAGGGDGNDTTDADLRSGEVIEFERLGSGEDPPWISANLA
jgi:hypothetical protein